MAEDEEEQEEQETNENLPAEVYRCACGELFPTLDGEGGLRRHFFKAGRRDGKGVHKSQGLINRETGEVLIPPWEERTAAQKAHGASSQKSMVDNIEKKVPGTSLAPSTPTVANAIEIKYVPRVYTTEFTPIMRSGMAAAVSEWGWGNDISLGDFLDTVIFHFFKERGISLGGYVVEDKQDKDNEEVPVGSS